jgi:HSP90 family molecular chaperone
MQNSLDAIGPVGANLGPKGWINIKFDRTARTIQVSDNGKGLTRTEVETVFSDLARSGKRDIESAIGGFGLAKAAPLLGGDYVEVITTARNNRTGQLHEIRFGGNPDELLKGIQI